MPFLHSGHRVQRALGSAMPGFDRLTCNKCSDRAEELCYQLSQGAAIPFNLETEHFQNSKTDCPFPHVLTCYAVFSILYFCWVNSYILSIRLLEVSLHTVLEQCLIEIFSFLKLHEASCAYVNRYCVSALQSSGKLLPCCCLFDLQADKKNSALHIYFLW